MLIRVAIIDDCDLTIVGACTVLKEAAHFQVVATGHSLDEVLQSDSDIRPDVTIINEWFYNTDVLSAVEQLRITLPTTRIIVTGTLTEGLLIRDLFAAGVKGYLFKGDALREVLITAINTVMANRPYLSPTANAEFLVAMQSPLRDWQLDDESRQVLRLLSKGLHVNDIAKELDKPIRHIYWVRQKLRKRFNASTNEHLVMRAAAEGFAYSSG
jgi:DNA-binding NarL/FixJ family response regulator